jgi:hypothetical protein
VRHLQVDWISGVTLRQLYAFSFRFGLRSQSDQSKHDRRACVRPSQRARQRGVRARLSLRLFLPPPVSPKSPPNSVSSVLEVSVINIRLQAYTSLLTTSLSASLQLTMRCVEGRCLRDVALLLRCSTISSSGWRAVVTARIYLVWCDVAQGRETGPARGALDQALTSCCSKLHH